jgi:membrane-bound lytic murein transglycosylase D
LFGIAKLYKVTTGQLKEWNHLTSDNLNPGQKLRVSDPSKKAVEVKTPAKTEPAPTPTTTEKAPTTAPTTPPAAGAEAGGEEHHTVAAGETLYSIARSFGVTVTQLKAWNNLTDLNVKIGQKLIVKKK